MEIFSIILTLLLIPLLCLLAPVFLIGLLAIAVTFMLKRGQRIYVEVPRQAYGKRKNDHLHYFYPDERSGAPADNGGIIIVDEDDKPIRS